MGYAQRYDDKGWPSSEGRWVTFSEYLQAVAVLAEVAKLQSDNPEIARLALDAKREICKHQYKETNVGRCLTQYDCPLCGRSKVLDSSD